MQILYADRAAAVAGSFYSDNQTALKTDISKHLNNAKNVDKQNTKALIVPHAGYIYSGDTAAVAYKSLSKKYKNIFLLGSSHHLHFNGASIYTLGNYKTPLGTLALNKEIISFLMQNKLFNYEKEAHTKEHTLEVQLPFLQTLYNEELKIIPIILGTHELSEIVEISKILQKYFNDEENLFIISSDLSHYPSYNDAKKIDENTLNAIMQNNPESFISTMLENEKASTKNLLTSACGWSSILTLLYMTKDKKFNYELLDYTNSGDTLHGDKNRVVGYGAIRVYKRDEVFTLSKDEKKELLELVKLSLYEATLHDKKIQIDTKSLSSKLKLPLGAFVTLYKDNKLRGCIGRFEPNQALYDVIIDMAIASAQHDKRFNPVTLEELADIDIELSILTPRKQIHSLDEITLGKSGIYIESGSKHGTYLPHVATQMNWSKEEFVNSCAYEKAGLSTQEFKNAKFYTYEAIVFNAKEIK